MAELTTRRRDLLNELVELFLAEGFQRFTLADLAARLRCSKTTLYGFGHSKEEVAINAIRQFFRVSATRVEARTSAARDPAERIAEYLRAVAAALRPASPAFMADLAAHPRAREVYERNTGYAAERVRDLIAEGVDAGVFREVHAAFVADTVAAAMRRIQSGGTLERTGLHDADAYEELAALVLNGICTARAGPPTGARRPEPSGRRGGLR